MPNEIKRAVLMQLESKKAWMKARERTLNPVMKYAATHTMPAKWGRSSRGEEREKKQKEGMLSMLSELVSVPVSVLHSQHHGVWGLLNQSMFFACLTCGGQL